MAWIRGSDIKIIIRIIIVLFKAICRIIKAWSTCRIETIQPLRKKANEIYH